MRCVSQTAAPSFSRAASTTRATTAPPSADYYPDSIRPDVPSKIDTYFETAYDPRLDAAPLVAPTISPLGFINNAEFEGWDAMLELVEQRRSDKAAA